MKDTWPMLCSSSGLGIQHAGRSGPKRRKSPRRPRPARGTESAGQGIGCFAFKSRRPRGNSGRRVADIGQPPRHHAATSGRFRLCVFVRPCCRWGRFRPEPRRGWCRLFRGLNPAGRNPIPRRLQGWFGRRCPGRWRFGPRGRRGQLRHFGRHRRPARLCEVPESPVPTLAGCIGRRNAADRTGKPQVGRQSGVVLDVHCTRAGAAADQPRRQRRCRIRRCRCRCHCQCPSRLAVGQADGHAAVGRAKINLPGAATAGQVHFPAFQPDRP